jgi:hypothetical protein
MMLRLLSLLTLALATLAMVPGCGADGEGETSASTEKIDYPEGPTREFFVPGGDNLVQLYGHEASSAERERASRVVEAWMRARAAGDWEKVCRYFSAETASYALRTATAVTGRRKVGGCAKSIAVVFKRTDRTRTNTMTGPIDSLRIGQGRGYAQYHGNDGRDWIVPVTRERNGWRVAIFDPADRLK